jgi:hypothetical protein
MTGGRRQEVESRRQAEKMSEPQWTVEHQETVESVCAPQCAPAIPFVRYTYRLGYEGKERVYYVYAHGETHLYAMYDTVWDSYLAATRWCKTLRNAFKKQQNIVGGKGGMYRHSISKFTIPMDAIVEMERQVRALLSPRLE